MHQAVSFAERFNYIGTSNAVEEFKYVLFLNAERISSDLDTFTSAFNKTLGALQAAMKTVADPRNFDVKYFENHPTVQEFATAEGLFKEGFKSFNASLVLFMMYVRNVEHLPHSSLRNGSRGSGIYLRRAKAV